MALFKPFLGSRTSLDAQELHAGYAYFCIDDGSFHIDYADSDGNLHRKQLNAKDAETLMGKSLVELQSDWSVNDETSPAYIKNRPFYTTDAVDTELINETLTFEEFYNGISNYTITNNIVSFTENQPINVIFDSATYNTAAVKVNESCLAAGNLSILNEMDGTSYENTNEPFCLWIVGDVIQIYSNQTELEHTVVINTSVSTVVTIPHKYLGLNIKSGDGKYSTVEGSGSQATGENAHAEGSSTTASGTDSHAEGSFTTASGFASHVEGNWAVASARYAHAEGYDTEASGDFGAHAEGYQTVASGEASHVEGSSAKASGDYSHAEGMWTTAASDYQHVQGKFNIVDDANKYAHIVGNGNKSGPTYSNAHTLDWNGNAWFAGNVKVGGTGQDDTAAKTLATTDDLSWNSLKDRPFYYDEDVTIYEATITTNDLGGFFAYIDEGDAVKSCPALVDGKTYTVVFDDVSYSCVCVEGSMLGNLGLLEYGEDTGEPFAFVLNAGSMIGVITTDTISTEHSIQVDGSVIKTIDEQYLPELPYITPQQGNQYWVSKSDFAQTNSMLTYKGKSYSSDHDRFMWFLTPDGIWNINLIVYDSAQKPAMSAFRMNYDSSTGTLHFYWKDESNTTKITTVMNAFLRDVNTGAYLRRETSVDSITIGTYTKKSHNVDFYINKSNPQPAEIVRSFDDYVETYSKDETDALLSVIRPKSTTVTISAANWTGSTNPWSQVVTVSGATENSKIDLCPTALQIVALQDAGVSLMLQNDSGVVTAWAMGNKPTTDYTINVLLTEVSAV